MRSTRLFTAALAAVAALLPALPAGAQYCALRDPVRKIYDLYPEATSYRSIVRTVSNEARDGVDERLSLELHFNELGRHTLYVALDGRRPLGLVHVRSEQGRWGLVENVWSLDLDLRILDFRFQRCRDPQRGRVESADFVDQLRGKGLEELRAMLDADSELRPGALNIAPESSELAAAVVRSALKTIVVTDEVWRDDLAMLRVLDVACGAFPATATIDVIEYAPEAHKHDRVIGELGASTGIDHESMLVLRARDGDGAILGYVIRTAWSIDHHEANLWWTVAEDLRISSVLPEGGWPSLEMAEAFSDVSGLTLDQIEDCSSAARLAGADVLVIASESGAVH